jgi:nifR3 family TIM-barrel protein
VRAVGFNGRVSVDAVPTAPLRLGRVVVDPPVVLAPMAGVTNAAFRQLCRELGAGLYVCEMITSRGVVERDAKTLAMLAFDPGERVRSVQLYGVDPRHVAEAVRILVAEHGVGHVDLNFGCPVPKVTRRGGGAALPYKRGLLEQILRAAVRAADPAEVPVTIKTRIGIDAEHETYLDAGRLAQDAGCAAVALHARTADQHYAGEARWEAIATLTQSMDIPVLGNGDIWEAEDALRMVEQTGCAGVVVGRGCLGRPWLFRDLAAAFAGDPPPPLPSLGEVADMIQRHGQLLAGLMGEDRGMRDLRKHMAWYLKGFVVGQHTRAALGLVASMAELERLLGTLDCTQPFPSRELGRPRGRQGNPRRVSLPEGWLADTDGRRLDLSLAEVGTSGG